MKKLICILSSVLMIFLFSAPAFANDAGPEPYSYDAVVSNTEGARTVDVYGENDFAQTTIPFQTKVHVQNEYKENGVVYANVKVADSYYCVKTSDLAKKLSKVDKSKGDKLAEECVRCIINKDGGVLRDGPAESFQALVRIPYGTIVKATYGISEDNLTWIYVTYKNYSGWLYCYEGFYDCRGQISDCATVLTESRTAKVVQKGYSLYATPTTEGKKVVEQIPVNTSFTFRNAFFSVHDTYAYVSYKGTKGWLPLYNGYMYEFYDAEESFYSCEYSVDAGVYVGGKNGTPLYHSAGSDHGDKVLKTIPYNTMLSATKKVEYTTAPEYDRTTWLYVSYNGTNGWVKGTNLTTDSCSEMFQYNAGAAKKSFTITAEPKSGAKTAGTVQKGESMKAACCYVDGSTYIFIKTDSRTGWYGDKEAAVEMEDFIPVHYDQEEAGFFGSFSKIGLAAQAEKTTTSAAASTISASVLEEEASVPAEPEAEAASADDASRGDTAEEPAHFGAKTLIICCIAAVVVLGITAVVLLVLLNKKKTQNNIPRF